MSVKSKARRSRESQPETSPSAVHAIGALVATKELEVAVGQPCRLQLGQGGCRFGRIVDDRDEPIGRVADGSTRTGR